jgi:hypothetical protein
MEIPYGNLGAGSMVMGGRHFALKRCHSIGVAMRPGGLTLAVSPAKIDACPNASIASPRAPRKPHDCAGSLLKCVTSHASRVNGNKIRLRALVQLLRLSPSEIARASGVSRSYVVRVLSPRDGFSGSKEFFRVMESKLGQIIEARTSQFFTCPAVPVARARDVLELAA